MLVSMVGMDAVVVGMDLGDKVGEGEVVGE